MKNTFTLVVTLIVAQFSFGQLVINELDCDTSTQESNIDTQEFIELKSNTSNFSLDGYVLVFFNGSENGMNSSYLTIDLDGYVTDVNGLFLIGSDQVSPFPQLLIPVNTIQNGADAVALYQGNWDDFPDGTLATIHNLVDVLMYDTDDDDDIDMINIFNKHPNFTSLQQISEGSKDNTNSIQLNNNGTYSVKTPTPRQLNDGSGVQLNGINISIAQNQYTEGESFNITFTTEQNVTSTLSFNILLHNGTFNDSDFTGNTSLTIPTGQNNTSTTITLDDDVEDEGDEVAKIRFDNLPAEYLKLNNNIEIRVVDNDFFVAPFGTPLNPTFGTVNSTQPTTYYNNLDGLSGANLRQALQNIIANPAVVRAQTYADVIGILKEADQNPANSNQVWLVYLEEGRAKLDFQTTSNNSGKWNREHTFPRSLGGFGDIEADEIANGKDIFWATKADSLRHANSDAHALRAADGPENSSRSNQHYGQYIGPTGNQGSFYGDVARSVLYLDIRYNGLQVVNGYPSITGQMGDLETLLNWHRNDPPDDYEMNRNNVVYTWQFNRNPFIDQPDLVEYIWGNRVGQTWSQPLSIKKNKLLNVQLYPNPASGTVFIKGLKSSAHVEVFSIESRKIKTFKSKNNKPLELDMPNGIYLIKITSEGKQIVKKLIVSSSK
ncbi:endonuclease [Gelatiniphilus marinus]|uniref:Endonuclease n=1 Tax=Gelatiniphilus marinus TaxID=1759464 RepID=A0ABW5JLD8_9FLAO